MPGGQGWTDMQKDEYKEEYDTRKAYCDSIGGIWTETLREEDQEVCHSCYDGMADREINFSSVDLQGFKHRKNKTPETFVVDDSSDDGAAEVKPKGKGKKKQRAEEAVSVSSPSEIDYSDSGDYETGSNFSDAHVFTKGERVRHNNRTVRVRQVKAKKQQIKLGTRSDKYEVPFVSQPTLKQARKRRKAAAEPGAAGPSDPRAAGPSDPGAAGPSDPGAAGPSDPGAAGPSDPRAAGPSEPPKASKKWKAGDSVLITVDGKQYFGTIFDRKGEFSVYYRDGTGTLRYKNLSEDGILESITKRKKGGTRKTQRRFW